MRSARKPEPTPADDAEAEHDRQHLGAAGDAVAEVAAIGDDVHLRHRHRDAAGKAGDDEERLHERRRDRARRGRRRRRLGRVLFRRLAAEGERQRQQRRDAEQADADMRRAPAGALDEMLQHRRPQRAREIVAGGADRDRDAAPAHEPMRDVGDERREGRGRAEKADQHALDERELPDRSGVGGADIAEAERDGADRARHRDADSGRRACPWQSRRSRSRASSAYRAARPRRGRRRTRPAPPAARRRPTTCRRRRSCSRAATAPSRTQA